MTSALTRPLLSRCAASLGGLLAVLAAAFQSPLLLAAGGAAAFGAALAVAALWRSFHAAGAPATRPAFIGS